MLGYRRWPASDTEDGQEICYVPVIGKWWRVTKIPKDYIWVVFEPMPQENWSVGGILVSEKK